ncbi:MAG: DUF1801 domain-containing protein [Planctomycetaceae bacterium]
MDHRNPQVDQYLIDGCGRCPLGGTPRCKVHTWPDELNELRRIVQECGLTEELKWGVPCYTSEKKNIAIVSAFKEYCSLSFFKGALLRDEQGILTSPGENSQSARQIRFTSVEEITSLKSTLKDYLREAIQVEKSGQKVDFKAKSELTLPDELQAMFRKLPALESAFRALTPGRQRGYVLFFSSAKQPQTRVARIEKHIPRILEGLGMHD